MSNRTVRRALSLIAASGLLALPACSLIDDDGAKETERDDSGEVTERNDDASVFEIRVGDCFNLPDESSTEIDTMAAIPCTEPHEAEAYHELELEGDEFPGATEVENQAVDACMTAFDTFVGLSYNESTLDFYYLTPTQDTWDQIDDRLVSCLILDPNNPELTESLQGAAR